MPTHGTVRVLNVMTRRPTARAEVARIDLRDPPTPTGHCCLVALRRAEIALAGGDTLAFEPHDALLWPGTPLRPSGAADAACPFLLVTLHWT